MEVLKGRRARVLWGVLVASVLVLAACGNNASAHASPGKATDSVSWAESPGAPPTWIWPYMPATNESNINLTMQYMLYRPLYFFGGTGQAAVDENISLGQMPSFSADGKTITITLKPYKWSNGETVTAQDVLFFINMMKAEPKNFYDYVPGLFPDNVVSATATSPSTLVLVTNKAYSPKWFLYNQLSLLTPMPEAWDVTGPGQKSDCATNVSDCAAVFNYLTAQSKNLSGYAQSPVWSVVDGPWKLKSFNSDGNITFVPNHQYSGSPKAQLKQLNFLPFTSEAAEFNTLRAGKAIDVGYLPPTDLSRAKPANSSPVAAGPNPLANVGYTLAPWNLYGFSNFYLNFNNPTDGPLFKQLYFRQAVQSLVDQAGILKSAAKNYGTQTTGPVPLYPPSSNISSVEKNNPYPFSIAKAKSYLSDNGWTVKAGGTTTCTKPGTGSGECGAGVKQGQDLSFQFLYTSGSSVIQTEAESLKSNASQIGMNLTIRSEAFATLISNTAPCSGPNCTWQFSLISGWSYGPDFYPTGESLFATGAASNFGGYSNPTTDKLINATLTTGANSTFLAYENNIATQLPVIWEPQATFSLTEVGDGLKGVTPQNPFNWLEPELWHY